MAHPGRLHLGAVNPRWAHLEMAGELPGLVGELCAAGLEGIEVFYPVHTPAMVAAFSALAREYKLFMTGGSDYHGWERNPALGPPPLNGSILKSFWRIPCLSRICLNEGKTDKGKQIKKNK